MDTLKTIDGKDFKKSFEANIARMAFFSSIVKCEANLTSIKNTLNLDSPTMKRLEKLKELGEKKGSSVISSYLKDLDKGYEKFDENVLENMELLINVWDDYYSLNKTYQILLKECIDLLEKNNDESSKKKISGFLNLFKTKFKEDIDTIELDKMKQIQEDSKKIISIEEPKVKKYIVGIGEDAKNTTLFSFLRCNIHFLLDLRNYIRTKNEIEYKKHIDLISNVMEHWQF